MRKLLLLLLCLSPPALAQNIVGNITASGATCGTVGACLQVTLPNNVASVAYSIQGVFTATIQFEVSQDGTNYVPVSGFSPDGTVTGTNATTPGTYQANVSGMTIFRLRASAFSSGPVVVSLRTSLGASVVGGTTSGGSSSGPGGGTNFLSLIGNVSPPTIPANAVGFVAPYNASFTSYLFQIPSTPPAAVSVLEAGAPTGNVSALSYASTTGSGNVVLSTTPTLVTPVLGAATGTSLSLGANGGSAGTIALNGSTSGAASLTAPAVAGTTTNPVVSTNTLQAPSFTTTLYSAAGTPLPACAAGLKGWEAVVSDATAPTFNATYTSGGAVTIPVICNGTNWVTY